MASGTPEEVKKRFPGTIYALETPFPAELLEDLEGRHLPGVRDLYVFGSRLHVVVDEGGASDAVAPWGPQQVAPSLEDVFVALVRAGERKGD